MRLHTNVITAQQIHEATPGNVWAEVTEHGSRTHKRAFEVKLHGNGTHTNSGAYGAATWDDPAATWDEWGIVIANLYGIDPAAIWGSVKRPVYSGVSDFRWQTGNRFDDLNWEDQHKTRHAWRTDWDGGPVGGIWERRCKCGAIQRRPLR